MKRLMSAVIMIGLCAGVALAQGNDKATSPKMAGTSGSAAEELKRIENDWTAASKSKDATKLGAILADNWVGLGWDGKTSDKAKLLADLKSPGNTLSTIEMGPMEVRLFGETAVVTGSDTETSTAEGKDTSGKYIWTDVFVKQGGRWKAVSSQSTKAPQ
jgi:ketosteroid isomerase-like protein